MAESTPETEKTETAPAEAPVEAPAKPKRLVIYLLKNVVRGRTNRTARAVQPGRRTFVQRLAGGTILVRRARPARITEAVLKANFEEIKKLVAAHLLVVTTEAGAPIDLKTFEVAPLSPASPVPNPPLDSAKNDKNENIGYKVPPTPEGTIEGSEVPELITKYRSIEQTEEEPAAEPTAEDSTETLPVFNEETPDEESSTEESTEESDEGSAETIPPEASGSTPPAQHHKGGKHGKKHRGKS